MKTQKLAIHLTQTKAQNVGTLATKNKKIYFEYDKDFLKTGLELSPYKLPLRAKYNEIIDEVESSVSRWKSFAKEAGVSSAAMNEIERYIL